MEAALRREAFERQASLAELLRGPVDTSDPGYRDPALIRRVAPILERIGTQYFRAEAEGLEHLPRRGPFLMVGNHNGGPIMPDAWVMLGIWTRVMGADRPAYAMVHDAALAVPVLRNAMVKLGALRATPANAELVLARGAAVIVYPGGELDCLRSFARRHRVDLHGRTGFIRIALRAGVPVVPFVNAGGHEVYVTLHSSRRLARWSGLEWLTRVKTVPLNVGLPWGFWMTGFLPYVPLPAKFEYKFGAPIRFPRDPAAAEDEGVVREGYERVTGVMQGMLDELAERRRWPVVG